MGEGHPTRCEHRGRDQESISLGWDVVILQQEAPEVPLPIPALSWPYLGSALEVEGEHVLAAARLALPHQEHAVALQPPQLHQLSRLHTGDGPVEPGAGGEELLHLRPRRLPRAPRRRPCQAEG